MVVGMMPPKLAQMMINFATQGDRTYALWDPFCGLGTTLIEALHGGYTFLLGSDISQDMVISSGKNLKQSAKDVNASIEVFHHDAQKIDTHELKQKTVIVTEGMLGKNFSSHTINHSAALEERKELTQLYGNFFRSAYKNDHIETLVCCLPFWNIGKEAIYMPLFEDFSTSWKVSPLCRSGKRYIYHMRPGQYV